METEAEVQNNGLPGVATAFVPPKSVTTKNFKERKKVMAHFNEIIHDIGYIEDSSDVSRHNQSQASKLMLDVVRQKLRKM